MLPKKKLIFKKKNIGQISRKKTKLKILLKIFVKHLFCISNKNNKVV